MKTFDTIYRIPFLILGLISMASCMSQEDLRGNENGSTDININGGGSINNGSTGTTFDCNNFSYSDTLYHINIDPEQIILPVNELSGTFESFPEGLELDSITGAIDINKSETGLKYRIEFKPSNNASSCSFFLSIAGINYLDEIFVLDQGERFAKAIYNGNQDGIIPCEEYNSEDEEDEEDEEDDDDDSCKFDIDGPDGNKLADFGVSVDHDTGEIDMLETLEEETFGENPINGDARDFTLYYRISDESLSALNKIGVRLFYYETMADVPQELIDEIQEKRDLILSSGEVGPNFRTLQDDVIKRKPRPPYLVIVARLQ
ncbi:molybdopterin-binding domain-containing protein [Aquiflexum lacus]|uniref:hypothetical protein n=1 Tax=Aquiflexum lacus TaxID=2483805 RepID=UPI0018933050|nr:hypothetical protein [Aquiflexum lacus]